MLHVSLRWFWYILQTGIRNESGTFKSRWWRIFIRIPLIFPVCFLLGFITLKSYSVWFIRLVNCKNNTAFGVVWSLSVWNPMHLEFYITCSRWLCYFSFRQDSQRPVGSQSRGNNRNWSPNQVMNKYSKYTVFIVIKQGLTCSVKRDVFVMGLQYQQRLRAVMC